MKAKKIRTNCLSCQISLSTRFRFVHSLSHSSFFFCRCLCQKFLRVPSYSSILSPSQKHTDFLFSVSHALQITVLKSVGDLEEKGGERRSGTQDATAVFYVKELTVME